MTSTATQTCWTVTKETGFLMNPDPIADLGKADTPLVNEAAKHLQSLADALPTLIANKQIRPVLRDLPVYDMSPLAEETDFRVHERAFQIYDQYRPNRTGLKLALKKKQLADSS